MNRFIEGALVMGCLVICGFFIRFWRKSHDRLFFFFALAFLLLGVNWTALTFSNEDEPNTELYVVRLIAFVVILIGILDKNRSASSHLHPRIDQTANGE